MQLIGNVTSRAVQGLPTWAMTAPLHHAPLTQGIEYKPNNAGAEAPPVLFFSALSFSPDFDRGTYGQFSQNCP